MNKKLIILFLIIAFLIRLIAINQAVYDDESDYIVTTQIDTFYGLNNVVFHPPLVTWINFIPAFFGISIWLFRLVPIIFGLLTIFFAYLIAKKVYNEKAALFSAGIMALSFYHILASTQIGDEGAILAFLYTFGFYSYLTYEDGKKLFYWLTGIAAGLALLAKDSSLMFLGILTLYIFTKEKKMFSFENFKKTFLKMLPITIVAFLLFSIYIILAYLNPVDVTEGVKVTIQQALGLGFSLQGLSLLLFWAGPLLLGLFVLSLFKSERKDRLFLIWSFSALIIYLIFIQVGDHSRYFMNIIPALAILGGNFLSKIKFTKRNIVLGISILFVFFIILALMNIGEFRYVPRTFDSYISEIKALNTDFLFSYTTSSGPLFLISFFSVIFSWLWSLFFLVFSVAWVKKKIKYFGKLMFIAFLAVSLAFNVFLIQENLFHNFHANPNNVIYDMTDYYRENNIQEPVYSNNAGLLFHMNNKYVEDLEEGEEWFYTGVYGENLDKFEMKGYLFLLDYTPIPRESELWKVKDNCNLIKEFKDKKVKLGYVYRC